MDFGSIPFIVWFLPAFLLIYYVIPSDRSRKVVLILGSIGFYAVSYTVWIPHLLALTCLTLLAYQGVQRFGKPVLAAAVLLFVGILVWNKTSGQLMPGISFLVFTILALLFDCNRKQMTQTGVLQILSYLLFFPKMLSGPIARLEDMESKRVLLMGERNRRIRVGMEYGLVCFIIGLGYKVLLANSLSGLWYDIQTIGFDSISTPLAWMGIWGYSMQLYFDFQGYSLMAIGIAKMLGYRLPNNFNSPYLSKSISEFYRRWHMTLGSWFRDYIYIPLGGSRKGRMRTVINLGIVWILTGLWHGFGWNFLLWGCFLFFWISVEKLWLRSILEQHPVLGHIYVCFLIPLSWVFFALPELQDIKWCFLRLFAPLVPQDGVNVLAVDYLKYGSMYGPFLLAGVCCIFPFVERWLKRHYRKWYGTVLLLVIFWFSIYQLSNGLNNPFLYFRF